MIDCEKDTLPCDPTSLTSCLKCNSSDNFHCVKVDNNNYACAKQIVQHNSLLEDILVDKNGQITYICKYPQFANHNSLQEPCRKMEGCSPSGQLINNKTHKYVHNLNDIDSFSNFSCLCNSSSISFYNTQGFPECKSITIGELLDNVSDYKGCVGFTNFDNDCFCPPHYISNKNKNELLQVGYKESTAIDLQLLPKTCIKKPCVFDPFSNKKHPDTAAEWNINEKTCKCDESQGIIGIYINEAGNGNAVNSTKYNACLEISANHVNTPIYSSFYIRPTGEALSWFKPWDINKDMFPQFTTIPDKDPYINFSGLPTYIHEEFPLDLETAYKQSTKYSTPLHYTYIESLLKKFDKTTYVANNKYKDGDIIRNVLSVTGKRIFPTLITDNKKISIYNHSIMLNDDELINVPKFN
jgi:hypothetical protein